MSFTIDHASVSDVIIQKNCSDTIGAIIKAYTHTGYLLLTDSFTKTLAAYDSLQKSLANLHTYNLAVGEQSKSIEQLLKVLQRMQEAGLDRKAAIIALGGGVIGDLATVAAGLYYRGIDVIQIPTTLLSMVDSSLGGKGAVNFGTHKNTIGLVHHSRLIIIDPDFLKTLPEDQVRSAMGEIIKYAIVMDKGLFETLERAGGTNDLAYEEIIRRCVQLKMHTVVADPQDTKGIRNLLNFGHTLGQAIELLTKLAHGEAVAVGMSFAIQLSLAKGMIDGVLANRMLALITKYKLPTSIGGIAIAKVKQQLASDKKSVSAVPRFVLVDSLGHAVTNQIVNEQRIEKTLRKVIL